MLKIVCGIVEGLINSLGVQSQAEKSWSFQKFKCRQILRFICFCHHHYDMIVAFEALGIEIISQPATAMLNEISKAIPNIIAASLILLVAYIVSRFVGRLVAELIAGTGVDEIPAKLDVQRFLGQTKVSNAVGWLIVFFTMLFAVSEAADRLGFDRISGLIAMFIHFGANILLGAVILVIGFWLCKCCGERCSTR
ncbi:mechanosensitive ion channel [Acinetobacter baumannii]